MLSVADSFIFYEFTTCDNIDFFLPETTKFDVMLPYDVHADESQSFKFCLLALRVSYHGLTRLGSSIKFYFVYAVNQTGKKHHKSYIGLFTSK